MWRSLSLILVLSFVNIACGEEPEQPLVEAVAPATPAPDAPKTLKRPPEKQDVCANMHRLLVKCSGNPRLRSDSHFKRTFLINCRRESARDTAYSKQFMDCAASSDCEGLTTCSRSLEAAVVALGPEHIAAVLKEGRREEAKKFCWDNPKAVENSEAFHEACHPLLEEARKDKAHADDHGSCPLHGKH